MKRSIAVTLRGPVLVATDLSPQADEALRQGARLATALASKFCVCHVVPELIPDGSVFAEFRRANVKVGGSVLAKAREAVEQQLNTVVGGDARSVEVILDSGTPHVGLLRQTDATGAGVVVASPGSVALDVVRHAAAAVLIARPSPHGPVIAATDFSDVSLVAVHAAAAEARRRASPLHLLHASDVGLFALGHAAAAAMPYLLSSSPIALEGLDDLRAVAKHRLEETLAEIRLSGKHRGRRWPSGGCDRAIRRIHRRGTDRRGTHGRSGLARLTLGNTAASVIESAPCSVLVVRWSER